MPGRGLTEEDVAGYVADVCFQTGPPGLVGAESEWLVTEPGRSPGQVALPRLRAAAEAAAPLPAGSAVSYEPGGQLELSSPPCGGVSACHAALGADLSHLGAHLARAGLRLSGRGVDPLRSPRRQLDHPRYAAMEAFFDTHSRARGAGRTMMCATAAAQVCVDVGADAAEARRRWELAHALGPVLVAAFANSPLQAGRPTGWRSTRQAVWAALDPRRTAPPRGGDPVQAWSRYALDAPVMALRRDEGPWLADPGITFREWLQTGAYGYPDRDDLAYHLSTLFPPVRPRGFLELRMVDAQAPAYWAVPLAVIAALLDDRAAAEIAREATAPVTGRWVPAARDGLTDPALARAARTCFTAAREALPRLDAGAELAAVLAEFTDRYVNRGRCPADDLLCPPVEIPLRRAEVVS